MRDYVAACTVGSTALDAGSADPILDLNGSEENELPFLTIATNGGEDRVNVMIMETRVHMARLEAMISVGFDGCKQIKELLDNVVRTHGHKVLMGRSD